MTWYKEQRPKRDGYVAKGANAAPQMAATSRLTVKQGKITKKDRKGYIRHPR